MRVGVAISLGLVVGLAVGVGLGRSVLAPGGEPTPAAEVLEVELEQERSAGAALREQVARLEAQAARVATPPPVAPAPQSVIDAAEARPEQAGDDAPPGDATPGGAAQANAAGSGFQDARLLALGFHPRDVERLHEAWETLELDRLYLQDERARSTTRDGRFWMRMRELEQATLEDLGAVEYDAMLYAGNRRNRVRVDSVFDESPADEAGFEAGDEILEYGERPLYGMHELKAETSRCELGMQIPVTVLRDGSERRIWTPCGPLGMQLQMVNAPPRS